MRWHPHVTVATIIEHESRFLMVEETGNGDTVFNQPAGHLEPNESFAEAALRETLEETGWQVQLNGFLGVYQFETPQGITYIRHCFTGIPLHHDADRKLDEGIVSALWLTAEEILAPAFRARSISVQKVLRDYLSRRPYPLDMHYYEQEQRREGA